MQKSYSSRELVSKGSSTKKIRDSDLDSLKSYDSNRKTKKDIASLKSAHVSRPRSLPHHRVVGAADITVNGVDAKLMKRTHYENLPANARVCYKLKNAKGEIFIKSAFVKTHATRKRDGVKFLVVKSGKKEYCIGYDKFTALYIFPDSVKGQKLVKRQPNKFEDYLAEINRKLDKIISSR
jgi:hypothetical protein